MIIAAKGFRPKFDGSINVEIIDLNNDIVKSQEISFKSGETLVELINLNFDNVIIVDGMITSIETLNTPSDWSSFICIYVNDEMSNVGINDIKFNDKDKISFVMTKFDYVY